MKTFVSSIVVLSCSALLVASHAYAQTCVVSGECGDVDASGGVTASDALKVLNRAVGQPLSLTCNCELGGGVAVTAEPVQTGQSACYDTAGSAIDCTGTGQDGEFQAGASHSFVDNGDGTITDEATGLMWEKLSADGGIHDSSNAYSITDAVAVKIASLNAEQFAGHDDWRLPNRNELATIVNFGTVSPATYSQFNDECAPGCTVIDCSCTQNSTHWTSTSQHASPDYTYFINFSQGDVNQMQKVAGNTARVRAVRAIP
jgi:hypothetical protein